MAMRTSFFTWVKCRCPFERNATESLSFNAINVWTKHKASIVAPRNIKHTEHTTVQRPQGYTGKAAVWWLKRAWLCDNRSWPRHCALEFGSEHQDFRY